MILCNIFSQCTNQRKRLAEQIARLAAPRVAVLENCRSITFTSQSPYQTANKKLRKRIEDQKKREPEGLDIVL
jgi:hypothetical protein